MSYESNIDYEGHIETQEKTHEQNEIDPVIKRSGDDLQSCVKRTKTDSTLGGVVAGHYNSLEEKGLAVRNHSRILHLRNFNNWIKSYLIGKHIEDVRDSFPDDHKVVALDLGCGKGGDLFKWQKVSIRHLVCVDIAETSLTQCKERYDTNNRKRGREMPFSAEFIVADCTAVCIQSLMRQPAMRLDITSCQFAFHYCFESLSQAETMVKNAVANLNTGGYFILTIPDANYIMSELQRSGSNSFGNEVFRIEFPADRPDPPPLFGDRYQFYLEGVVDCPEFLVHQPTLMKLCSKHGLRCVYQKRFSDVFKEAMTDQQCRALLHKMTALETYPAPAGSQQNGDGDKEYTAAREHLDATAASAILTLSASEWDAINLYTAFAFKKSK